MRKGVVWVISGVFGASAASTARRRRVVGRSVYRRQGEPIGRVYQFHPVRAAGFELVHYDYIFGIYRYTVQNVDRDYLERDGYHAPVGLVRYRYTPFYPRRPKRLLARKIPPYRFHNKL